MRSQWKIWSLSAIAALITGLGGGVQGAVATLVIAPELEVSKILSIAGIGAVFGAISGLSAYLKQSPIPVEQSDEVSL